MTPFDTPPSVVGPLSKAQTRLDDDLTARFRHVRATTRRLAAPLSPEDMVPQSMTDASPTKWHLGHTAWFFETFLLEPSGRPVYDPSFRYLFNSYYEALGERQPRDARGLMTRPSVAEVMAYRDHVDAGMERLFDEGMSPESAPLIQLGLAHEEQHQELLLTDVLHLLAQQRFEPAYRMRESRRRQEPGSPLTYTALEGGVVEIGHEGEGFAFDIEGPRHGVLLRPYRLADRLVTNGEWLAFMEDGGYERPELWLSDGWAACRAEGWRAPLYWAMSQSREAYGPFGLEALQDTAPVHHVSFYEADAYARWFGARLPLEAEWEHAASGAGARGAWLDDDLLEPQPSAGGALSQMFGDVWEWTASPYTPYPGFRPAAGAVGEYNGKFAVNQMVLKGGSCITPKGHVRASYRNFFQPHQRWQVAGVRLAQD